MNFLEINEIEDWCLSHTSGTRGLPDLHFKNRVKLSFESDGKPVRAFEAIAACIAEIDHFSQALLWITQWGVWPSSEDWPVFYAWRGDQGERRSLEKAPGHKFEASEKSQLVALLNIVAGAGWDAQLLCLCEGRADSRGVRVSHDGYLEILSADPIEISW